MGENYELVVSVRDGRESPDAQIPSGIFNAFFSVVFADPGQDPLVAIEDSFERGSGDFTFFESVGELRADRLFDAGGISIARPTAGSPEASAKRELFSIPFTATAAGDLDLNVVPAITQNEFASFYFPFNDVTSFVEVGDQISIVGGSVNVVGAGNLSVTEGMNAATFTVDLTRAPTDPVTLTFGTPPDGTFEIDPTSVTFNQGNFDTPQSITVTATDDNRVESDANVPLSIAITSDDPAYQSVTVADLAVIVLDNDVAGYEVVPTTNLQTNETGTSDSFQVRLRSEPSTPINLEFQSSDPTEAVLSGANMLTFTANNWDEFQLITVTGVDDLEADGDQPFTITSTILSPQTVDSDYRELATPVVTGTNADAGDVPGYLIQPMTGLETDENGATDAFTIRLRTRPTDDVVLNLASSDPTEGNVPDVPLRFTADNFDQLQTITITGADDDQADGDVPYRISLTPTPTSDLAYRELTAEVNVTNLDRGDVPSVDATFSVDGIVEGAVAEIEVVLATQPSGDVTVTPSIDDPAQATLLSSEPLLFTPQNWQNPQSVPVSGTSDMTTDGDATIEIRFSSTAPLDSDYDNIDVAPVTLSIFDVDAAEISLNPAGPFITSENGGTSSFSVLLPIRPIANVIIDVGVAGDEVDVNPSTLTFTPDNFNSAQTVALTGLDDQVVDGDVITPITFDLSRSLDPAWAGLGEISLVSSVNVDNDQATLSVVPTSANNAIGEETTDEIVFSGTIGLAPLEDVTIIAETTSSRVQILSNQIRFAAGQTASSDQIRIAAVDNEVDDGDKDIAITFRVESQDQPYADLPIDPLTVRVIDDDEVGVIVANAANLVVDENQSTATFNVRLSSPPSDVVTFDVTSLTTDEVIVSGGSIEFDQNTWDQPQTITVTGVPDDIVDADTLQNEIQFSLTRSNDPQFNDLPIDSVFVRNDNIDVATITIDDLTVDENELNSTGATVTLTLDNAVAGSFTVGVTPLEGTAESPEDFLSNSGTIFFDGLAGETQTFTILGSGFFDSVELDETFSLQLDLTTTPLLVDPADIDLSDTAIVTINDTSESEIGFFISNTRPIEGAAGTQQIIEINVFPSVSIEAPFSVNLRTTSSQATAGVDYLPIDTTLNFSANDSSQFQTVQLLIFGDDELEPNELINLQLSDLVIDPRLASQVNLSDPAAVEIVTDEAPRLEIRPTFSEVMEGDDGLTAVTFEVVLTDAISDADGFTVDYQVSPDSLAIPGEDFEPTSGTLTFTGTSAETQTFSVNVIGDRIIDFNQLLDVTITPSGIDPTAELNLGALSADLLIVDDDQADISVTSNVASVAEGDAGTMTTFTLTATLSGAALRQNLFIPISQLNSTTDQDDFAAMPVFFNFMATDMMSQTATVTFEVAGDDVVEPDEVLIASLSPLENDPFNIITDPVEVTILNDDGVTLRISDDVVINESDTCAEAIFELTLDGNFDQSFMLPVATSDGSDGLASATASQDYQAVSQMLTFGLGQPAVQTVRIPINDDLLAEFDEGLTLQLGAPVGLSPINQAAFVVPDSQRTVTIQSDDVASLAANMPTPISESGGPNDVTQASVSLSLGDRGVQGGFEINYRTRAIAGRDASDHPSFSGTIAFAGTPNEQQPLTIPVASDSQIGTAPAFEIVFDSVTANPGIAPDTLIVTPITLIDDDTASVSFATTESLVFEADGTASIDVRLATTGGAVLSAPLVLNVVPDSSATASATDFTLLTPTVTFPAGSTDGANATIELSLNSDDQDETPETIPIRLQIANSENAAAITATTLAHTVTVVDDPRDAVIRGVVYVDADWNRIRDEEELRLFGVPMRLEGVTDQGESIVRNVQTEALGQYEFDSLPAGNYAVTQQQPADYYDGPVLTPAGTPAETLSANTTGMMRLEASEVSDGHDFTETGLRVGSIDRRIGLSRQPSVPPSVVVSQNVDAALARWF
ncbi:MAG: Calx-beta domain-containing protein [Planctomycetota bacterium]